MSRQKPVCADRTRTRGQLSQTKQITHRERIPGFHRNASSDASCGARLQHSGIEGEQIVAQILAWIVSKPLGEARKSVLSVSARRREKPRKNGQPRLGSSQPGLIFSFGKRTCKPNSVVCGHSSRRRVAADTHQRPTRRFRPIAWSSLAAPGRHRTRDCSEPASPSLFGLAPCGVYPASGLTTGAVRSYRTISPLPQHWK